MNGLEARFAEEKEYYKHTSTAPMITIEFSKYSTK